MKYRRFGNALVVRIDKGEEIMEQLKAVCETEKIRLASVTALGATDDFTVGNFDPAKQAYKSLRFTGSYEIVSLIGTVNTMHGEFYAHLHLSAGDDEGRVFGGHLYRASVSVTCEMVLQLLPGELDRFHDFDVGVNLLAL